MNVLQKHTGSFLYKGRAIAFEFWSNSDGDTPPDTVPFLGAGQVGNIPRWVAESAGAGVVVVGGVPHWEADPSAKDIAEFSTQYVASAFATILAAFELTSAHLLAESQAAPGVVILAHTQPKTVRNLALVRPLGFSVKVFGGTPAERLRTLKRRLLRTYFQLPQTFLHDPRNFSVSLILWRAMLKEPTRFSRDAKYAAGVSYDLTEDCRKALKTQTEKGSTFTIFMSEDDRMFTPKEIIAALDAAKITIDTVVIPNTSHTPLAVRGSRQLLAQVLTTVRSV